MKKAFYIFTVLAISSACTSNFERYNKDNSRLNGDEIVAEAFLDPLIYQSNRYLVERTFRVQGEIIQYTVLNTTATHNEIHRYDIRESDSDLLWRNLFNWATQARYMSHYARIASEQEVEAEKNKAIEGIGIIMEALMISNLTDIFGDIPYSESMMVEDHILQPVYDRQEDIYRDLFQRLETANLLLGAVTNGVIDKADILYGGDCVKWRKFGNSLYLRLLMRLSNIGDPEIEAKINSIYTSPATYPVFAGQDDRAILKFTGLAPNLNYFESNTVANFEKSRHLSEFLIGLMSPVSDPRLDAMFDVGTGGEWIGVPSGESVATIQKTESRAAIIDTKWRDNAHYFAFMNYSEVLFIFAEAAVRGYISADAGQLYDNAVKASCLEQCGYSNYMSRFYSEAKVSALLSKSAVKFPAAGTDSEKLERIMQQKYISLFFIGFEAWNDIRRTGYPVLPVGSAVRNGGILPTRLIYPNSESSRNKKNWLDAVIEQGGDNMMEKVWWAK